MKNTLEPITFKPASDLFANPTSPPVWTRDGAVLRGPRSYEIDLARVTSHAEALEWVAHVAGKAWSDAEGLRQLARLLQGHLHGRRGTQLQNERAGRSRR